VPAQKLIYADAGGNVGQAMAAHLPQRLHGAPDDIVLPADALRHWRGFVTARDLPMRCDPEEGFVASANDRPVKRASAPIG
jgi:penicillin amidase